MNHNSDIECINANNIRLEFEEYAYSVSHDLSAPIRAMVEFSKLLAEECPGDKLNDEAKKYLSLIIESGQKAQAMMDGLLLYSRINTHKPNYSLINLDILVKKIQRSLEHRIQNLELVIISHNLPEIYADIEQISFIFDALIDNAIKFQPRTNKPQVTISAEKIKNGWQFSIADNGIGIRAPFLEKIFKLFARLHPDDQYPGVGLGLTLAQKIINKLGGKIWVQSTPEKGSTFYFTLPINYEN